MKEIKEGTLRRNDMGHILIPRLSKEEAEKYFTEKEFPIYYNMDEDCFNIIKKEGVLNHHHIV